MADEQTVKVHFIDGSEKIVPAKDIQHVGEEGARKATALVDGKEVPIYKRSEPEWGPLWYEQAGVHLATCQCAVCRWQRAQAHDEHREQAE